MGKSINVKKLYFAEVTETSDSLTFGTPEHVPGMMEATRTPQIATGTLYGDGKVSDEETAKTAYNISMNHNHIPQKWKSYMEGTKIASSGVESGASSDKPKPFAMGFETERVKGGREMIWFPYCKASPIEETATQKTDNITISSDTITITAFEHDLVGRYYTKISSENTNVTEQNFTDFFTKVQTTDTIAAASTP